MVLSSGIAFSLSLYPYLIYVLGRFKLPEAGFVKSLPYLISFFAVAIIFYVAHKVPDSLLYQVPQILEQTGLFFQFPQWIITTTVIILMLPNVLCLAGNFNLVRELFQIDKVSLVQLHELHKRYTHFLLFSSILLVFGVVCSSLLRLSLLNALPGTFEYLFPPQFVLSYALVFSVFLILFYLPTELVFRAKLEPIKLEANERELKKIEKMESQTNIFKLALSLLAPVISGILIEVLKSLSANPS